MGRGLDGYLISVHWHCAVLKVRERRTVSTSSGGYGEGETPLPIPNRAVKPLSADGTWPARAWESRSPPVYLLAMFSEGRMLAARRRGLPKAGQPARGDHPYPGWWPATLKHG
jgi:hypothetical protein